MKEIRQYEIRKDSTYRLVFLDKVDLQIGDSVRIKGENDWWQVTDSYATVPETEVKKVKDFDSDWRHKMGNKENQASFGKGFKVKL